MNEFFCRGYAFDELQQSCMDELYPCSDMRLKSGQVYLRCIFCCFWNNFMAYCFFLEQKYNRGYIYLQNVLKR